MNYATLVGTYLANIIFGTYLGRDIFGTGHVWSSLPLFNVGTYLGRLGRDIFGTGHVWSSLPLINVGTYLGRDIFGHNYL